MPIDPTPKAAKRRVGQQTATPARVRKAPKPNHAGLPATDLAQPGEPPADAGGKPPRP